MEPTTLLPVTSLSSLVSVEYGGWSLQGFLTGRGQLGEFQEQFFRAGHAHAGVLLVAWEHTPWTSSASVGAGLGAAIGRNGRPGR